jgi:hypothetical protein
MRTTGTLWNDTEVDHVAALCDIADGGDVWTVENMEKLAEQFGFDGCSEIRGLEFDVLMTLVRVANRCSNEATLV